MPVAEVDQNDEGLPADSFRTSLAGHLNQIEYPRSCPQCAAAATIAVPIAKVFRYNHGTADEAGWKHRIAEARPLFCPACERRHRSEQVPVTTIDRLKSVLFTELALPAIGSLAFALFLLEQNGVRILRHPATEWLPAAFIGVLLLVGVGCLRAAWTANEHRRVPRRTPTSRAFDFGDDASSGFQTVARTYAFRNAAYEAAFTALNAERSRKLLSPVQRRSETLRTVITAAVIAIAAALCWWFARH